MVHPDIGGTLVRGLWGYLAGQDRCRQGRPPRNSRAYSGASLEGRGDIPPRAWDGLSEASAGLATDPQEDAERLQGRGI